MELTNEQRKYLGLELIEPAWERIEMPNNCLKPELSTGKDILFFDGDILRKVIWLDDKGSLLLQGKGLPDRYIASDMRDNYPYGLFAVPRKQLRRIHASSGTTGYPQPYRSPGFLPLSSGQSHKPG